MKTSESWRFTKGMLRSSHPHLKYRHYSTLNDIQTINVLLREAEKRQALFLLLEGGVECWFHGRFIVILWVSFVTISAGAAVQ